MSTPTRLTLPMPRLGETMEEGTIAEWLVRTGEPFRRGDPLLEIETDKTMVEYPALGDGTLLETLVAAGDVVEVGTPIAVIETRDTWDGIGPAQSAAPEPETPPADAAESARKPSLATDVIRLRATPLARRIAQRNGIALTSVTGTGRRGRIEAGDVQALLPVGVATPAVIRSAPGSIAPVYCVHGFAGLGSNWAPLRASLQRAGLGSQAPDMPGHGRNPVDAGDVETLVDWLTADLAAQFEAVHLVGHSLGAHLATLAALRDPSRVARLTLIAPAGCGIEINGAFLSGMAAAPGVGELSHLMRLLGPKAAQLDNSALTAMAQELAGKRLTVLAQAAARGDVQRIDTIGAVRTLSRQMPVRAIFGLADRIIPRDHAFHLPPGVACHMVETGHMPHWDATEEVAAIIAAL